MIDLAHIDALVENDRRAIAWYAWWLGGVVSIGVALLAANLTTKSIGVIGSTIGTTFVLLLGKPPLSEVLKRRDRVTALLSLRGALSRAALGSAEAERIESLVWDVIKKMLEG